MLIYCDPLSLTFFTVMVGLEQPEYFVCENEPVLMVCAVATGRSVISSFTLATETSGTAIGIYLQGVAIMFIIYIYCCSWGRLCGS